MPSHYLLTACLLSVCDHVVLLYVVYHIRRTSYVMRCTCRTLYIISVVYRMSYVVLVVHYTAVLLYGRTVVRWP